MGTSLTAAPTAPHVTDSFDNLLVICEWAFLLTAIGAWVAFKTYNPVMNVGIGLWVGSWVARWLRLGKLSRSTPLDVPMFCFLVSVVIACWVAPNQQDALSRAFLFGGAVGLYYTVVNSSRRALTASCAGFMAGAALFGLYFISQNSWSQNPGKFSALQEIGALFNRLIPDLGLYKPHPNVVSGLVVVALAVWTPFFFYQLSNLRSQSGRSSRVGLVGLLLLGGVLGFDLLMTQSRTAWLAIVGALGIGLWWLAASQVAKWFKLAGWILFAIGLGLGVAILFGLFAASPQFLTQALGTLPGPNSAQSRIEIYGQVWQLAQDTPFTGGGLAAFPSLYSTYVLVVPSLYLTHAHNAFLNIFLEQGWLGGLTFFFILLGASLISLPKLSTLDRHSAAIIAAGDLGVAAVIIQGLGDATLVASRITPFVFFPAGVALYLGTTSVVSRKPWQWLLLPLVAILFGAAVTGPFKAQWYANLGAVEQNRVTLQNWPTNKWDMGQYAGLLGPAEMQLQTALALDSNNKTALSRLGLIASLRQDWYSAAKYLQSAYDLNPHGRGVMKTLGYTYAWLGEFDKAEALLASVPEAHTELEVYVWWWGQYPQHPELSQNALILLGRIP